MNDFLFWACVSGPVLLADGLLARYEVPAYSAGFQSPPPCSPRACPTPGAPTPTALRTPTWSVSTASANAGCGTPGTAASW